MDTKRKKNRQHHHHLLLLHHHLLLFICTLLQTFSSAKSQSFIGVNYGQMADNLPPASTTASLLESTTISKVRLYGADPAIIQALAGTNISLVIGVSNGDMTSLASDPAAAASWAAANVLPYLPASSISIVSVGNEALNSGDNSLGPQLLPAMQNLRSALSSSPSAAGVKISTVHSMAVLAQSDPPSSGAFHSNLTTDLNGILGFLRDTGAPFMINPYPYFAYQSDPRPETLAFCLFESNPGRFDSGSKLTYTNMFDAQVDAVRSSLDGLGFTDVEIVVAETGWPYKGDPDEVGPSVENAQAFVGNLVTHLRSGAGTPRMPGKTVDTYLFALYDEDLKPGPTSERSFGLYRADGTMNYEAGLARSSSIPSSNPNPSSSPNPNQVNTSAPAAPVTGSVASPASVATAPPAGCVPTGQTTTAQTSANGGTIQPTAWACYIPNAAESYSDLEFLLYTIVVVVLLLLM